MKNPYRICAFCFLLLAGCASAPKFTVKTDPAGADIFVDGERVGKTPATIKVKFTENAQMVTEKKILCVKLAGFREQKEVICPEGAPIKTLEFTLVPEVNEKRDAVISKETATTSPQENKSVVAVVSSQTATPGQETNSIASISSADTVTMGLGNNPIPDAVTQPPADAVQAAAPGAETANTQSAPLTKSGISPAEAGETKSVTPDQNLK